VLEWTEIIMRLGIATLAGGVIGLNRDLHGKPVGVRTLGLVALATAMTVTATQTHGGGLLTDAASRVIQGVLTGIGFLGAGVILHREGRHDGQHKVLNLTSAACVWFTACVGIICGAGEWRLVGAAFVIALLVLVLGGPIERAFHQLLRRGDGDDDEDDASRPG